jgi:hypothetical protein
VPRPAWNSPPEQSGPALTVQAIYEEACGQPRTATCVEWSPLLLLLKLRCCCCRGLRGGKNCAEHVAASRRSYSRKTVEL